MYGIIPGSTINYKFNVVNRAELSSTLKVYESSNLLKNFLSGGIGDLDYAQGSHALNYYFEASLGGSLTNAKVRSSLFMSQQAHLLCHT